MFQFVQQMSWRLCILSYFRPTTVKLCMCNGYRGA